MVGFVKGNNNGAGSSSSEVQRSRKRPTRRRYGVNLLWADADDWDEYDETWAKYVKQLIASEAEGRRGNDNEIFRHILDEVHELSEIDDDDGEQEGEDEEVRDDVFEGIVGGSEEPEMPTMDDEEQATVGRGAKEKQDDDNDDEFDPDNKIFWDNLKPLGFGYMVNIPTKDGIVTVNYDCGSSDDDDEPLRRKAPVRSRVLSDDDEPPKRKARGRSMIRRLGRKRKNVKDRALDDKHYAKLVRGLRAVDGRVIYAGEDGNNLTFEESEESFEEANESDSDSDTDTKLRKQPVRRRKQRIVNKDHHKALSSDGKASKGAAAVVCKEEEVEEGLVSPIVIPHHKPRPSVKMQEPALVPCQTKLELPLVRVKEEAPTSDNEETEKASVICLKKPMSLVPINKELCTNSTPCSEFRRQVTDILAKPYDHKEYTDLLKMVKERTFVVLHKETRGTCRSVPDKRRKSRSYLGIHPELKKAYKEVKDDEHKVLMLLRGFFFWLQHMPMENSFRPWHDKSWMEVLHNSQPTKRPLFFKG